MRLTERRLEAAERRFHDRDGCRYCGYGTGEPTAYTVSWDDDDSEAPEDHGDPEFCENCGREIPVITVVWDPE